MTTSAGTVPEAPPPADEARFPRDGWLWALVGVVLAYGAFLAFSFAPGLYNIDANEYYKQAHLLLTRGRVTFPLESPIQFVGNHWIRVPSGELCTKSPPGVSVIVALVLGTLGPSAAIALDPALALFGLVGMYLLARPRVGGGWAVLAAACLALNPIYLRQALFCDSQMTATVLLIWALFFFDRWNRTGRTVDVGLSGLLMGVVATARYPESILVAAFAVGIGLSGFRSLRALGLFLLAAALPVLPLAVLNTLLYGAPWRTGYLVGGEQSVITLANVPTSIGMHVGLLQGPFGASCFLELGLLGLALLAVRRETRPLGACLALVVLPLGLLYASYGLDFRGEPPQNVNRLFLPVLAVLILAGCAFLEWALPRTRLRAAVVAAVLALSAWGFHCEQPDFRVMCETSAAIARASSMVEDLVPPGSVVVAPRPIHAHLDFLMRWRCAEMPPNQPAQVVAAQAQAWSGQPRLYVVGQARDVEPWTRTAGALRLLARVETRGCGPLCLWEWTRETGGAR